MSEKKYRLSIGKAIIEIPLFLNIITLVSLVQIVCLEFNIGFRILNEALSNIVSGISYAYITSMIFYFLVDILPEQKKNYYDEKIARRQVENLLKISYPYFAQILCGTKYPGIEEDIPEISLDARILKERLTRKETWNRNMEKLVGARTDIIRDINNIMQYDYALKPEIKNALDCVRNKIKYIRFENFINPIDDDDGDEKDHFIGFIIENLREIMDSMRIIITEYNN